MTRTNSYYFTRVKSQPNANQESLIERDAYCDAANIIARIKRR